MSRRNPFIRVSPALITQTGWAAANPMSEEKKMRKNRTARKKARGKGRRNPVPAQINPRKDRRMPDLPPLTPADLATGLAAGSVDGVYHHREASDEGLWYETNDGPCIEFGDGGITVIRARGGWTFSGWGSADRIRSQRPYTSSGGAKRAADRQIRHFFGAPSKLPWGKSNPKRDPRMRPLPRKYQGEDVYDPREESVRAVERATGSFGIPRGPEGILHRWSPEEIIQRSWERYQDPDAVIRKRQEYELMLGARRQSGPYRITQEPTEGGLAYFVWPIAKGQRLPQGPLVLAGAEHRLRMLLQARTPPRARLPRKRYTKNELEGWLPPEGIFAGRSGAPTRAEVASTRKKERAAPAVARAAADEERWARQRREDETPAHRMGREYFSYALDEPGPRAEALEAGEENLLLALQAMRPRPSQAFMEDAHTSYVLQKVEHLERRPARSRARPARRTSRPAPTGLDPAYILARYIAHDPRWYLDPELVRRFEADLEPV